jgi:transcription elongation factor Elf1
VNRRQAAQTDQWAAQDAAGNPECLLCGGVTLVFADPDDDTGEGLAAFDLCGECNRAFRELAQALVAAEDAREERAEVVAQVAGQLELEDDEDEGEEYELDVDAVMAAIRSGDFGGVNTMDLGSILHLATLTVTERDLVKGELWRRA